MAFKDIWRPRVDGVDDADSSAVNEIAEAVIDNENANKKNATAILGKQDKLSKEQLENIDKVPDKQEALTEEQLQNIQDVPNKADADYVNNTFANALKGSAIGQSVNLTDVSPIEHTLDVKLRNKNLVTYPYDQTTKTRNGLTFTDNGDGTVTVNGTATANTSFRLVWTDAPIVLEVGEKYTISGSEGGSKSTWYILFQNITYRQNADCLDKPVTFVAKYPEYYMCIEIKSGAVCDNVVFRPTLIKGETYEGYLPYVADLSTVSLKVYDDENEEAVAEYTPLADGTVEGVTSVYPTTILSTDASGAVIDCEYNRDANKVVEKYDRLLVEEPILYGKSILSFGDSIAYGVKNNGKSYAHIIAEKYGMSLVSNAKGGATIAENTQTTNWVSTQIDTAISNNSGETFDFVLLEGGVNDVSRALSIGEIINGYDVSACDVTTFTGALETHISKIRNTWWSANVIYIITHKIDSTSVPATRYQQFHDRIIEVCNKWCIPYVDIYNNGQINSYIDTIHTNCFPDGDYTHPNETGYKKFYVPPITSKMKELI